MVAWYLVDQRQPKLQCGSPGRGKRIALELSGRLDILRRGAPELSIEAAGLRSACRYQVKHRGHQHERLRPTERTLWDPVVDN